MQLVQISICIGQATVFFYIMQNPLQRSATSALFRATTGKTSNPGYLVSKYTSARYGSMYEKLGFFIVSKLIFQQYRSVHYVLIF